MGIRGGIDGINLRKQKKNWGHRWNYKEVHSMDQGKEKEPRMNEAQKELLRQYQEYCKGTLSQEEKKRFEEIYRLLYIQGFQKENSCLLYILWGCLFALLIDAGYKAIIGGDWITPLAGLSGMIILGFILFFIVSITPD